MDITGTIREDDEKTLTELADAQWRDTSQQASAMLEQALRAQRARTDPSVAPKTRRARQVAA